MEPLSLDVDHLEYISNGLAPISAFDEVPAPSSSSIGIPTVIVSDASSGKNEVVELHEKIVELKKFTAQLTGTQSKSSIGALALDVLQELVDDQVYSVTFEMHRAYKLKLLADPSRPIATDGANPGLVDCPGYDIFGHKPEKNIQSFKCPNCSTLRQPAKFAPHLEKCMGMGGRESRRAATRPTSGLGDGSSSASSSSSTKRKTEPKAAPAQPSKKLKLQQQAVLMAQQYAQQQAQMQAQQQAQMQAQMQRQQEEPTLLPQRALLAPQDNIVENDTLTDLMMYDESAGDNWGGIF